VVASNSSVSNLFDLHSKQASYRTYVLVMLIPRDTIEDALYWDPLDPHQYVRPRNAERKESPGVPGLLKSVIACLSCRCCT
jgi:hypothetical protein